MRRILTIVVLALVFAMPVQAQTPEATVDQTSMSGNAWEFVPEGEPGEVSIVAWAGPHSQLGEISVLVRNNSGETISNIEVKSEFRDMSGKLLGVGDVSSFEPNIVEPGGIAFGLSMGGKVSDQNADVNLRLTYDVDTNFVIGQNLEFIQSEWSGDRILGEFRNPTEKPMSVIHLSYACFDENGELINVGWGSANGDLGPGETTTFQAADDGPDSSQCERYLITGNGF